ncbi:helix-turn-helix domain-containing protein [Chengkuizengella axinellae]|uniref:Helix-turn-helix transcriptional regulator n=1 Tax=Chengkuizengella axinellae TaxID=3064388 RepID=A0ABT9IVC7_9BACL|nr:helix-turn-helix transcriptional regulator [Chengkuizengella sp. 2205SS18-9]MDP5272789.1 helix-turn-helix transcriptional regulator [Chengkuizengella sp. 2205SS18-9]
MITTYKPSSLGELIQYYRKQAKMTLVQLETLSEVDKANLSRIESGQIKRPSLANIQKIGSVLHIPFEELIEQYIEVEERTNILFSIFNKLVQVGKNIDVITKVARKTLEYSTEDSLELVGELYTKTGNIEDSTIRLALYQVIINYSRAHGIMPYIAKGLLQTYLIERDDFTKLRSTYVSGKGILFFEDFLSSEERGVIYYKLEVHAYNLYLFEESIEMGKKALDSTISDIRMQANTIYIICNCYYYLGDYVQTKKYLDLYKEFSLPEVKDNTYLIEAVLYSASGSHQSAISILQENLPICGNYTLPHVVNLLINLYLQENRISEIEELLQLEEKILANTYVTPFKKAELGHYFKLKGDYFILTNRTEDGINYYLEAATRYSNVDLIAKESECLRLIMNIHTNNKEKMNILTIEKLENYLNCKSKTSN